MQDCPQADIPGAAALMVEDPWFEYVGMAQRVRRSVLDQSQMSAFVVTFWKCFLLTN